MFEGQALGFFKGPRDSLDCKRHYEIKFKLNGHSLFNVAGGIKHQKDPISTLMFMLKHLFFNPKHNRFCPDVQHVLLCCIKGFQTFEPINVFVGTNFIKCKKEEKKKKNRTKKPKTQWARKTKTGVQVGVVKAEGPFHFRSKSNTYTAHPPGKHKPLSSE